MEDGFSSVGLDKVSVIIPVYNTGQYVINILSAVTQQTYKNLELIIVNDGSSDGSSSIIRNYLCDTQIEWILIETQNRGVSAARNLGVEKATGNWVICLDSDDYIQPEMISRLLYRAKADDANCAFCDYQMVLESNVKKRPGYDKGEKCYCREEIKHKYYKREVKFIVAASLIKANLAKGLFFDEECPHSEDTLYTWELIYNVGRVSYVRSPLYNYLNRAGSKQHSLTVPCCLQSIERYTLMGERLVKTHPEERKFISKVCIKYILNSFHILCRCQSMADYLSARKSVQCRLVWKLISLEDIKLSIYSLIFLMAPRLFYRVSQ